MFPWVKHKLSRGVSADEQKASHMNSIVAYNVLGRPVWTPKQYDQLAQEGYQKNVIVYRCVHLIARGLASVPLLLYDHEHEIEKHPLLHLLKHPNPFQAGCAFMESVVSYLLLSGNAYMEAVFDNADTMNELYTLRPDRMKIIPGPFGGAQGYEYRVDGQSRQLFKDPITGKSNILHIKLFNPLNDWYGMSPVEAAAGSIDQHNAVCGHNLALLQNGGRPSGALMIRPNGQGNRLTQEQREDLRQDIRSSYEGEANAGRVMVLEGDFEWKEMGLSPKDLDFISGKNLSAREIAQAFGVPPMLVGIPGDATFANYREARFHLWEDTILPLLELILAELNLWIGPLYEQDLRLSYNPDAIAALSSRRESQWNKIEKVDFLTINEKRQAVGYTPIAGGDILSTAESKGEKNHENN